MPHIRIEYSCDTFSIAEAKRLLQAAVDIAVESTLFNPTHIKARLIPITDYYTGEMSPGFVHLECRTHPGKTDAQKTRLVNQWITALAERFPVGVFTAEIVETQPKFYAKSTRA